MGQCKDCMWWGCDEDGVCFLDWEISKGEKPATEGFGIGVRVLDDSGLEVVLKTGPLFGCNRFDGIREEEEDSDWYDE